MENGMLSLALFHVQWSLSENKVCVFAKCGNIFSFLIWLCFVSRVCGNFGSVYCHSGLYYSSVIVVFESQLGTYFDETLFNGGFFV